MAVSGIALDEWSFILDADTVINIINPKGRKRRLECLDWFRDLRAQGGRFYVPAFAWHEVLRGAIAQERRGDVRERKALGLLAGSDRVTVMSLRRPILLTAATIWAEAETSGRTVDDKTISGDTLVVAEARHLGRKHAAEVIVSDNHRHLQPLSTIPAQPFDTL